MRQVCERKLIDAPSRGVFPMRLGFASLPSTMSPPTPSGPRSKVRLATATRPVSSILVTVVVAVVVALLSGFVTWNLPAGVVTGLILLPYLLIARHIHRCVPLS